MTPEQFVTSGIKLFGRKKWKSQLAAALGINVATVHRLAKLELPRQIPGPYEVALKGLLQHKRAQDILNREALKITRRLQKRGKPYKLQKRKPRKAKEKNDGT